MNTVIPQICIVLYSVYLLLLLICVCLNLFHHYYMSLFSGHLMVLVRNNFYLHPRMVFYVQFEYHELPFLHQTRISNRLLL